MPKHARVDRPIGKRIAHVLKGRNRPMAYYWVDRWAQFEGADEWTAKARALGWLGEGPRDVDGDKR